MAKRRKTQIDIFKKLKAIEKPYFSIADLEKVLGLKRKSLYVALNRMVKSGLLNRIKRGIYEVSFSKNKIEEIANQLYFPSYLSFESVLFKHGIMDQIPYTLTFATSRKSKKLILAERETEYRQIKKELFFGYKKEGGILTAEPEKALLDQIYLYSLGKAFVNFEEWDFSRLDRTRFLRFLELYPQKVKKITGLIRRLSLR